MVKRSNTEQVDKLPAFTSDQPTPSEKTTQSGGKKEDSGEHTKDLSTVQNSNNPQNQQIIIKMIPTQTPSDSNKSNHQDTQDHSPQSSDYEQNQQKLNETIDLLNTLDAEKNHRLRLLEHQKTFKEDTDLKPPYQEEHGTKAIEQSEAAKQP